MGERSGTSRTTTRRKKTRRKRTRSRLLHRVVEPRRPRRDASPGIDGGEIRRSQRTCKLQAGVLGPVHFWEFCDPFGAKIYLLDTPLSSSARKLRCSSACRKWV